MYCLPDAFLRTEFVIIRFTYRNDIILNFNNFNLDFLANRLNGRHQYFHIFES